MNGTHPQSKRVTALAAMFALVLFASAGCQTHPTAMTNPFASPDRVPPPSTRTLLPGQAAPYYQGDPLPSMQGSTTQRPAAVASAAANNSTNSTDSTAQNADNRPTPAREPALAFSNESSVAIPSDDDPLRTPLPTPAEKSAVAAASATQPASTLAAAKSPFQTVHQASFNQPIPQASGQGSLAAANSAPSELAIAPAPQPMWRSPRIAQPSGAAPISLAPPPSGPRLAGVPTLQNPLSSGTPFSPAPATPSMGVRLRAVPSPAPQPVESSAPRIRLPGYSPQPASAQNGVEQAAYYTSNVPVAPGSSWPGGVMQTVQITPLNAMAYNPAPGPTVAIAGDGFRPRGSMR